VAKATKVESGGPEPRKPRILVWDIETDGIAADRVLCIGWKWIGPKGPANLLTYDAYPTRYPWWSDKQMLADFAELFALCDWHVTWYGSRFDQPTIERRSIMNGLGPLPPKPHVDMWHTARQKFGYRFGNRLQQWQDRLGLRDDKTPVKPSVWIAARHGDEKALQYIYEHCRKDVLVTEAVYREFKPWLKEPALALVTGDEGGCPSCGSRHIVRKGFKVADTRVFQQWRCADCGKWFRSAKAVGGSRWRTA